MLSETEQLEVHAILYAKGHYKVTDTITDLQQIIGKYAGMFPQHISNEHIIFFLDKINEKYNKRKYDRFDFIKKCFSGTFITTDYNQSITVLNVIKAYLNDIRWGIMAVDIPSDIKADPSILPLTEQE